jgi:uroporphyrin-3 C-methyltransferase
MSEDDPKPGVVIDVQPDTHDDVDKSEAPETPETKNDNPDTAATRPQQASKTPLVLSIVAIVAVVAAGLYAYQHWERLQQDLAAMDARINTAANQQQSLQASLGDATSALESQADALEQQRDVLAKQRLAVDEAKQAFVAQEQKLADENLRLQEREAELRAAVADVHRRVGRSGTQWIIAEVEYLLRIANHRVQLARDTETARAALEIADQRLRDTKDPGWAGVRTQVARDIAALAAFQPPDDAGMAARLSAMIEQIPSLKIDRATIGPERTLPEAVARDPSERSWDTLLDDLWSGFKDSVRIRERGEPVQAMLPPEQQFFLYENLKLHLEAARLGLARRDQAFFRENLQSAKDGLGQYFVADGTSGALRDGINSLLTVELQPDLPDLSQSLRALRVRRQLIDDVAPGTAIDSAPTDGAETQ